MARLLDFKAYFLGLKGREREAYARRAKTSVGYITHHLIRRTRNITMTKARHLAVASNGQFTALDLVQWFLDGPKKPSPRKSRHALVFQERTDISAR